MEVKKDGVPQYNAARLELGLTMTACTSMKRKLEEILFSLFYEVTVFLANDFVCYVRLLLLLPR